MPYDEFVRLQLAGDVLDPNDAQSVAAAGFLVAGAHNTTLPSSQKMRMTMAQDEIEDLVGVVSQTFLGLTTNCARCHDHKFDPISQKEYYQFAATLTGVKHGERTVKTSPPADSKKRIATIDKLLASLTKVVSAVEDPIRARIIKDRENGTVKGPEPPLAYATWEFDGDVKDSKGVLDAELIGGAKVENGSLIVDGKNAYVRSKPIPIAVVEKTIEAWVQLDNLNQRGGGAISIQTNNGTTFDAIVFGEQEPKKWMAGSNGFVRTRSFGGGEETEATSRSVHFAIVYTKDGTITGYRDGKPYGKPYKPGGLQRYAANSAQIVFGLRHGTSAGTGRMLAAQIHRAQFYNRALKPEEVALSAGAKDLKYVSEQLLQKSLSRSQRLQRATAKGEIRKLSHEKQSLSDTSARKMYTCVSSNPGETKLLRRGNVADPGEVVAPAGLSAVPGVDADFQIPPNARDADRRTKLADWITNENNPLFSRVIVNRLWHYHFGRGLVTTPNDFGYNGGKPSHPELLEWLAGQLKKNDYRLKPMHRLIVTSAAYKQSSKSNPSAAKTDVDNYLIWRKSPQRLEAEAIRDSVLLISNHLDLQIGGQGYRDVRHFAFKGSNFYEPLDEVGEQSLRRTIYRFSPRGGRNPFLDTFDCPDPSTTAPSRANTTTPLQALALLNNPLVFHMADIFAQRIKSEAGDDLSKQVGLAFELAYGRAADEEEIKLAAQFAKKHGLPGLCRIIFNSNEFVFVQ
jgi:hypothetical protein